MNELHKNQLSIGSEAAVALSATEWWKSKSFTDVARIQMSVAELCCPFAVFQESVEKTMGRPVSTHEFGYNFDGLWKGVIGDSLPATLEEIIRIVPESERILSSQLQLSHEL